MEKNERHYTNGEITVYWKPSTCIHSSVCYTKLLEVFNPRKRPWVNMEGSTTDKIIGVINECPTDALTWKWNDEEKNEQVTEKDYNHVKNRMKDGTASFDKRETEVSEAIEQPVSMQLMADGPIVVEGNFMITTSTGSQLKMMKMTSFCRCGQSGNMPFCDGSHRAAGFRDK